MDTSRCAYPQSEETYGGVTLRQFYAAHALTGLVACIVTPFNYNEKTVAYVATRALAIADAVLDAEKREVAAYEEARQAEIQAAMKSAPNPTTKRYRSEP